VQFEIHYDTFVAGLLIIDLRQPQVGKVEKNGKMLVVTILRAAAQG